MKANHRDTLVQNLSEIYSEHEWIDFSSYADLLDSDVNSGTLNLQYLQRDRHLDRSDAGIGVQI